VNTRTTSAPVSLAQHRATRRVRAGAPCPDDFVPMAHQPEPLEASGRLRYSHTVLAWLLIASLTATVAAVYHFTH